MNASIRLLLALTALALAGCAAEPHDAWSARWGFRGPLAQERFSPRETEQTTRVLRDHERARSGRAPVFTKTAH